MFSTEHNVFPWNFFLLPCVIFYLLSHHHLPSSSLFYMLLLLLSHFSHVQLCAIPSLGFSRQEHWSGLPFPSPMHKSEKWWSRSVVSDSWWPHGLQPTRILRPRDSPGKSTGVGCHCLLLFHMLATLFSNFSPTHIVFPYLKFHAWLFSVGKLQLILQLDIVLFYLPSLILQPSLTPNLDYMIHSLTFISSCAYITLQLFYQPVSLSKL